MPSLIIVYTPGVWDLLHVGHLTYLERARSIGDRLIVGVADDRVVIDDKGAPPIIPADHRLAMVNALGCVSFAALYKTLDFLPHLRLFQPEVFVAGEKWGTEKRHYDAEKWVASTGGRFICLPYYLNESSSGIKQRIREGSS